jgi:hypothetical protein
MEITRYFAWYECGKNIIAFATEDNIFDDCLNGEYLDYSEISELMDIFEDTGELCEDYLIATDVPLQNIDNELLSRGMIKDPRIRNIGWG